MPERILIVEDDPNIASLIESYLANAGFHTLTARDGREAIRLARAHVPGFVILDLLLPEFDGWEVARQIRRISDVPILILTAQADEYDRIAGFKVGADDYVTKPFSPRELVERVKAILRRGQTRAEPGTILKAAGMELDRDRHRVTRDGVQIDLTLFEFRLLEALMQSPGQVFTRAVLIEKIYGNETAVVDRVIDVHIGKLRQKIECDSADPGLIRTVRGVGYCFTQG